MRQQGIQAVFQAHTQEVTAEASQGITGDYRADTAKARDLIDKELALRG